MTDTTCRHCQLDITYDETSGWVEDGDHYPHICLGRRDGWERHAPINDRLDKYLDEALRSYLETALWASSDYNEDGTSDGSLDEDYDRDDIADDEPARRAIEGFLALVGPDALSEYVDRWDGGNSPAARRAASALGHDFFLTREGHGAGFWDRGHGELGDRLTAMAKTFGEGTPYVGDDGRIHLP